MVIFGVKCVVTKQGGHDVYGEKVAGASFSEKCAVVKLTEKQFRTTVRVDSGATRGGAEESRADAVLLMNKKSKVQVEDAVEMLEEEVTLIVISKRARYNVAGKLDHYEIEARLGS